MYLAESVNDLDLTQHSKNTGMLVSLAMELGYTVSQNQKRFITMRSPVQEKIVQVPPTGRQMNNQREAQIFRTVIRYGDPELLEDLSGHLMDRLPTAVQRLLLDDTRRSEQPVKELTHTIGEAVHIEPKPEPETVADTFTEKPLAYDSPIRKRTWPDGRILYVCGLPNCEFTGKTQYNVSGHIGHAKIHRDYVLAKMAREGRKPKTYGSDRPVPPKEAVIVAQAVEETVPIPEPVTVPISMVATGKPAGTLLDQVRELLLPGYLEKIRNLEKALSDTKARAKEAEERWEALRSLINQEPTT